MQERENSFKLDYYIELALKRRWLIIFPFCLAMIIGIYLALTLPRVYRASTLILVRPQRVPESFVQSIVTSDIESRISTIKQEILSRTNLEKVINQFNLFTDTGQKKMFMEEKVADLRERIEIEVEMTEQRKMADAFSIAFNGENPELTMRVANGLATFFIDENLKTRAAQATGTSDFLEEELKAMRGRLESVEQRLKDYRRSHMGELPEQLETNLRILDRLQSQLNEKQESLRAEKGRLLALESQIEDNRKFLAEAGTAAVSESGDSVSLEQLRAQLASLKSNYTDNHPDVIRLKAKITDLEEQYTSGGLQTADTRQARPSTDPAYLMIQRSLDEQVRQRSGARMEIKSLEIEIGKVSRQIKEYQQRVERTPKLEQELISLQRDYQNIQESYKSLLDRKLEAEIAVNMEKKQKGEQFRIIDYAALPRKPLSPNMKRLFMLALLAGLGFGCGLIYLLEFLDHSIKRPEEFEFDLGIAVLATVPNIYHRKDLRRRRLNRILTVGSLVAAAGLFAGLAVLTFHGVESTVEMVRPYFAFLKI